MNRWKCTIILAGGEVKEAHVSLKHEAYITRGGAALDGIV
jgi:hypothetical protein